MFAAEQSPHLSIDAPIKRGRGRPPGTKNKPKPGQEPPVGIVKRGRGRPPGSKNRKKVRQPLFTMFCCFRCMTQGVFDCFCSFFDRAIKVFVFHFRAIIYFHVTGCSAWTPREWVTSAWTGVGYHLSILTVLRAFQAVDYSPPLHLVWQSAYSTLK